MTGPNFFDRVLTLDPVSLECVDFRSTDTNNYIADISYLLAPNYKLRSITAFAQTTTDISSAVGSPLDRTDTREGRDFTQDLRLEIDAKGNAVSGTLGLFYGRFDTDTDSLLTAAGGFLTVQDLLSAHKTTSAAVYGELRYRFMDRYQLIGGGRLLHDIVESRSVGEALNTNTFLTVPIDATTKAEFTRALPKIGMTYDLDRNQTFGFTFSKGYRAGFSHIPSGTATITDVKPEDLDAYEISYRSSWAGRRLFLGGNLFYYDYKNQQIATDDPAIVGPVVGTSAIINGRSSHAYGAEVEARWRPNDRWQLSAGVGLVRTRFDDFVAFGTNFSGNEFPESPSLSFMAAAFYKDPSGWFAGANLRHVDGYFSTNDVANTPARFVSNISVVDARIGYEWEASKTKLTLFAKNILDEQYLTSLAADNKAPTGPDEATVADGRLVGVTVMQRF